MSVLTEVEKGISGPEGQACLQKGSSKDCLGYGRPYLQRKQQQQQQHQETRDKNIYVSISVFK